MGEASKWSYNFQKADFVLESDGVCGLLCVDLPSLREVELGAFSFLRPHHIVLSGSVCVAVLR